LDTKQCRTRRIWAARYRRVVDIYDNFDLNPFIEARSSPLMFCKKMKRIAILGFFLLLAPNAFSKDDKKIAPKGLSEHVQGLVSSYDIVTKYEHPLSYLRSLKVKDTSVILNGWSRYQLARTLLDVHHLCQALSHQGYNIISDKCSVLKLAQTNFKGFERCKGEGGYWTVKWAKFFETNQVRWGVDSTFDNQTKAEQTTTRLQPKSK